MTTASPTAPPPPELSVVLVQLFKGPVYRDTHDKLWEPLLKLRAPISDHVNVLGLQVEVDESEGYAFLRSRPTDDDDDQPQVPRLVPRRPLSFPVSLLLAILRKRLAEFDATSTDPRLVLSRDDIVEMIRLFMPDSSNEARLVENIDAYISKVVDLGFLRRLRGDDEQFEVRRILKAFVDGHWLAELDQRLDDYLAQLRSSEVS